ncbi:MAG TPA: hypothetical protein ENI73_06885, partial [Spirochaetes bacterium]|nr:hypothetical protein [Spirochaetota bacterium]
MKKTIATYLTIILSLGLFMTCSGDDPANINRSTSSENEKLAAQLTIQETVNATNQLVTEAANQGIAYNTNPAIKAYLAMFQGINEWTHTGKLSLKQKDIIKHYLLELDIQLTKENPVGVVPAAFAISGSASSFTISGSINGPDGGTLSASGSGSFSAPNYSMNILYTYTDYSIGGYIINGTTSVTMNGSNGNFTMTVAGNLSFSGLWTGSIQFTLSVTVSNGGATFAFSGTVNGNNINGNNQVATPTFSPSPGTYASTQSVSIFTTTSGATIRYTTGDGTQAAPTSTTGTLYSVPFSVSSSMIIKAIAYKNGT